MAVIAPTVRSTGNKTQRLGCLWIMLIKWLKKLQKGLECYGGRNIYLTEIRLKPFIMPLFRLILITVLWYGIIVPKHYKTNCKNSKIKPVKSLQVTAIKLLQILSDLNFLGTH